MLILHLSDLHFGNKNRFAADDPAALGTAFASAIAAACKSNSLSAKLHLVIVTGDVAESGLPSEFKSALGFFRAFSDAIGLSSDNFVFLPGNHDISWAACRSVRAARDNEEFPATELASRIADAKLANFRHFLTNFHNTACVDACFDLPDTRPLGEGGWLRDFPNLRLSVAALNTSAAEDDLKHGGHCSVLQAQKLMDLWAEEESQRRLKVLAIHHNPVATTANNKRWTMEELQKLEAKSGAISMSSSVFEHYMSDLSGFSGAELLQNVVRDRCVQLVLHGHHHDQGFPISWHWKSNGIAPVLSVGSFGLSENFLPGNTPLSCQLLEFSLNSQNETPRLKAIPLVYDGRFRLEGQVLAGAFRPEPASYSSYNQPLSLPNGWATSPSAEIEQSFEKTPVEVRPRSQPKPPNFYAEFPYIGSHSFTGRINELETLDEWASASSPHTVMLYEAIGGTGKSMLTWHWVNEQSSKIRTDWAGRFWYSFYERGATMVDFCRQALAYMEGIAPSRLRKKSTAELTPRLIQELRAAPWLMVLDGLERVLVSYHRYDAAQLLDEDAGLTDKISERNPCAAINPEDDDLLSALAKASPSKLLLTSRLAPIALLNRSGQAIPGVQRDRLAGLRPPDAEIMMRSCGVFGTPALIQDYLKSSCDCHPLVIGVLAGLVTDYLPDRGNFDLWLADENGGGKLNFAELDLSQRRNHILKVALEALSDNARQLLSTFALLSEAVEYRTLAALDPSLSPTPEWVESPTDPSSQPKWKKMGGEEKAFAVEAYHAAQSRRVEYENACSLREKEMAIAAPSLNATIRDLERRGLLQFDAGSKRYDLHPVVRGIAAGGMKGEEKSHFGQRVVDHFSQQAQNPYEQADSLEDFDNAKRIVRVFFQMGKEPDALGFILSNTFLHNLSSRFEAHSDILTIVRPFFSRDWTEAPLVFDGSSGIKIAAIAATSLRRMNALDEAFHLTEAAILSMIRHKKWDPLCTSLINISSTAGEQNRLALEDRLLALAITASKLRRFHNSVMKSIRLARFRQLSKLGMFAEADILWREISDSQSTNGVEAVALHHRALDLYFRGQLTESFLNEAEAANLGSSSAIGLRNLCGLRGCWHADNERWELAEQFLQQAVVLAHKSGKVDRRSEIRLARVKQMLGRLPDPAEVAARLSDFHSDYCKCDLAQLWLSIGNFSEAGKCALLGYTRAWGDGAPYSHWNDLRRAHEILTELSIEPPKLVNFDPESVQSLGLEKAVETALRALEDAESARWEFRPFAEIGDL